VNNLNTGFGLHMVSARLY